MTVEKQQSGLWVPRSASYDASAIDWGRLSRYAQRVARETALPPSPPYVDQVPATSTRAVERSTKGFLRLRRRTIQDVETVTTSSEVVVLGEHWPLHQWYWHHERTERHGGRVTIETISEYAKTVLLATGRLALLLVHEEELVASSRYVGKTVTNSVRDLEESDVTRLDFAHNYTENNFAGGLHVWGTREPRQRLRHAKGVGINLALKAVLEGRSPLG